MHTTVEQVDLGRLVTALAQYYEAETLNNQVGAVTLIMLSLCAAGVIVSLLWLWRKERQGKW